MKEADGTERESLALTAVAVLGIAALDFACVSRLTSDKRPGGTAVDYSNRRGFPSRPTAMRGSAGNVTIPNDLRRPKALRPFGRSQTTA